jgi:hypothetical protein
MSYCPLPRAGPEQDGSFQAQRIVEGGRVSLGYINWDKKINRCASRGRDGACRDICAQHRESDNRCLGYQKIKPGVTRFACRFGLLLLLDGKHL